MLLLKLLTFSLLQYEEGPTYWKMIDNFSLLKKNLLCFLFIMCELVDVHLNKSYDYNKHINLKLIVLGAENKGTALIHTIH